MAAYFALSCCHVAVSVLCLFFMVAWSKIMTFKGVVERVCLYYQWVGWFRVN